MLKPITTKMTDHSSEHQFSFSFHCDICGHTWKSVPIQPSPSQREAAANHREPDLWQREHEAAYERANREAMMHFNRCPVCKRWVCDDCFQLRAAGDHCQECAEGNKHPLVERREKNE